jgi:hypothetical protein
MSRSGRARLLLAGVLLSAACSREDASPSPATPPPASSAASRLPTIVLPVPQEAEAKLDLRFRRDFLPQVRRDTQVRLVVDLAEQPDLVALGAQADARGLSREERKRFVAEALSEGVPSARALAAELRGSAGVSDVVELRCLARVAFTGPSRLARELAQRPNVAWAWGRALQPPPARPSRSDRAPGEPEAWAAGAIGAPLAWARGWRGRGVHACVLDSAADLEPPELAGRRAPSVVQHPPPGSSLPDEGHGHGLAVVGAAAGAGGIGIAPEATWSVANPLGGGVLDPEAFAAVVDWLLLTARPDVVAMPWDVPAEGLPDYQLAIPVGALRTAGIAVAFPAGNSGPTAGANAPPANLVGLAPDGAPAFSVGGVARDLAPYEVTGRGPNARDGSQFPQVAAPGAGVAVIDPAGGGLRRAHGTSYAVGFAAGALALVLGSDPAMTGPQAERRLRETARDLGAPGPDPVFGHGLIDLGRASEGAAPRGRGKQG